MDFELTSDQRAIQALTRELADAEIAPNASAWDRDHRFPDELYPKLAEVGLMGVCVPEEYGGAGADFLSYVLVLEELSRADAGVGVTVAVHTSATTLPDPHVRDRRAALALRAAARARRAPRRVRPHRAGLRFRRRLAPDVRRAARRRLEDHGREAVDHERLAGGDVRALRADRSDDGRGARRLLLRPRRRARSHHARGGEARPQLVDDLRSRRRGCRGRPRPPPPRGGPRLPDRNGDAGRRPHRHRRTSRRDRAGGLRRRA